MEQISPMLQARIEQQQYQTQNTHVSTPKVDIGGAKIEQLDKDTFDYSIDDGKISPKDKLKNFAKGLISPITALFSSPKNFLIGAGIIAAGAALTIATGGAIAPIFVALGVTGGAIQLGTSIYKASKATTDDEAKSAWQGMGAGTSAVGMSVLGSKAALKGAGVDTKGMGFLKATVECFKQVPSSVSKSVGAFTSGEALTNLKNVFKPKKSANTESEAKNNTEPKTENKAETETQPKSETKAEPKPEQQTEQAKAPEAKELFAEPKSEQNTQSKHEVKEHASEAKAEPKAEVKAVETKQTVSEAQAKPKVEVVQKSNSKSSQRVLEIIHPDDKDIVLEQNLSKQDWETLVDYRDNSLGSNKTLTASEEITTLDKMLETLSDEEFKAEFSKLPREQRRALEVHWYIEKKLQDINAIIDKAIPIEDDCIVYRETSKNWITVADLEAGKKIHNPGLTSTARINTDSFKHFIADSSADDSYIFRIHLPKGTKCVKIQQGEILLPSGNDMMVTSFNPKTGIVDVEYIAPHQ